MKFGMLMQFDSLGRSDRYKLTFQYSLNIFKQYMYITTSTEIQNRGYGSLNKGWAKTEILHRTIHLEYVFTPSKALKITHLIRMLTPLR